MKHLRLLLIIAGGAFLLAMLTGLFSGIGFGTVLFRSFLTAILSGALAFGLIFAVEKFLPELTGKTAEKSEAEDDLAGLIDGDEEDMAIPAEPMQNSVDITLDDENTYELDENGDSETMTAVQDEDDSDVDYMPEEDELDSTSDSSDMGSDFVEEIGPDAEDMPSSQGFSSGSISGKEEAEEIGEDLPSLDQFSSTFNSVESNFLDTEESGPASRGGKDSVEIMGGEHSADELAKAVQTLLSKDEKG
ncbi:MAG: hypothetical protein JW874_15090 [Spirochaetales bacterium]|nr:hypothetical protein [Spirochaetales bacterium]